MADEIIVHPDDARNLAEGDSRTSAPALQPVSLRWSRTKLSLGLLPMASLLAIGVATIVSGRSALAALMAIIPSAAFGFTLIREVLDRRPRITIDETGVRDRGNRFGLVEWDDITGAYRGGRLNRSIIYLQIRNSEKYNDRLSPLRQLLRQRAISWVPLSVWGTQGNANEIVELIEREVRKRWVARAEGT